MSDLLEDLKTLGPADSPQMALPDRLRLVHARQRFLLGIDWTLLLDAADAIDNARGKAIDYARRALAYENLRAWAERNLVPITFAIQSDEVAELELLLAATSPVPRPSSPQGKGAPHAAPTR